MRVDRRIEILERGISSLSKEFRRAFAFFCCCLAGRRYEDFCRAGNCGDPKLAAETVATAYENVRAGQLDRTLEVRARVAADELGEIHDVRAIAAQESCFSFIVLREIFGGRDNPANITRIVRLMRDTVDMLVQEEGDLPRDPENLELAIESHALMRELFDQLEQGLGLLKSTHSLDRATLDALRSLAGWIS